MHILPVLDIMGGQVVHGVAGRRAEYRPIRGTLTSSTEPTAVARALHERFGLDEFYVADLDAITGTAPAWTVYERLQKLGYRLWVDAGVRGAQQAEDLAKAGVGEVVLGLETVAGPATVDTACRVLGADRVVFSLDLCEGRALGSTVPWGSDDPVAIVATAVRLGVTSVLVLDLARVGMGQGTGTEELCQRVAQAHPMLHIAAGGGVLGVADIRRLGKHGVATVLVAAALHNGRLSRQDLADL